MFSKKILGDGVAIIPRDTQVCAPISGNLKLLFHTGHAFVIESDSGTCIMVHIGIDTVRYQGKGFKTILNQGDRVKRGEAIVCFAEEYLQKADMTTMVVLMDEKKECTIKKHLYQECIVGADVIFEW